MEALLYFALWAGACLLMMRFGYGAHAMGHGDAGAHGKNRGGAQRDAGLRWVPPAKDTDPVCGKAVSTDKAKPSVHDGLVYYFYSRECRELFEAAPDLYVGDGAPGQSELEHSHA